MFAHLNSLCPLKKSYASGYNLGDDLIFLSLVLNVDKLWKRCDIIFQNLYYYYLTVTTALYHELF